MKASVFTTTLFFIAAFFGATVKGQNLVPNPSFEEYTECPDDQFDIDLAFPWTSYRNTPDYFHSCDITGTVSTPWSSLNGYQVPFDGEGMAGFITALFSPDGNAREILGVELTEPLTVGEEYYVSFQTNRAFGGGAHSNCDCAINNIGLKFTTRAYDINDVIAINNNADIYTQEVVTDSVGWTEVSGTFTADSAYSHLALGVFFTDEFNTLENYNNEPFYKTYYFFDGICVSADPDYCEDFLSNDQIVPNKPQVKLYPNPSKNLLRLDAQEKISKIEIYDILGKAIKSYSCQDDCSTIAIKELSKGTYLLSITFQNNVVWNSKFIKD